MIQNNDHYHLPRLLHSAKRLCCALIIPAIIIVIIIIIAIVIVIMMIKEKLTDSQRSRSAGKSHLKFRSPRISNIHTSPIHHYHPLHHFLKLVQRIVHDGHFSHICICINNIICFIIIFFKVQFPFPHCFFRTFFCLTLIASLQLSLFHSDFHCFTSENNIEIKYQNYIVCFPIHSFTHFFLHNNNHSVLAANI